jgi:hypothetical protein
MEPEHEWFEARFVFGGYIECKCGLRPTTEEQFNAHNKFMQD